MICPHCQADIRRKERYGRRCSRCRQEFALEPKENPLRLHDIRFQKIIDRISQEGQLFYTPAQLLHVSSQKTVTTANAPGCGCIFTALIVGGFTLFFVMGSDFPVLGSLPTPVQFGLGLAALLLILAFAIARTYDMRRPWVYLKLPMTLKDFEAQIIDRWQRIYEPAIPGLMDEAAQQAARTRQPAVSDLKAVLVSPATDILLCLQANGLAEELGLGMLSVRVNEFTPTEQTILNALQQNPELPVFVLHSASPGGLLAAARIRSLFKLTEAHRVHDLALHPKQVQENNLMRLGAKPEEKELSQLRQQAGPSLGNEDITWLQKGYYGPILGLRPARLIKIIRAAIEKRAPAFAESPETKAKAVGFMTWPS